MKATFARQRDGHLQVLLEAQNNEERLLLQDFNNSGSDPLVRLHRHGWGVSSDHEGVRSINIGYIRWPHTDYPRGSQYDRITELLDKFIKEKDYEQLTKYKLQLSDELTELYKLQARADEVPKLEHQNAELQQRLDDLQSAFEKAFPHRCD